MKQALIAYYTETGSTQKAANYMAKALEGSDYQVTLASIGEKPQLHQFDLIVLGSPIHGMNLIPEFVTYVNDNKTLLSQKKTAFFNVSYMIYTGRNLWQNAIKKSFTKLDATIEPLATATLGGQADQEMPLPARLLFGLKKGLPLNQWKPADADLFIQQITQI